MIPLGYTTGLLYGIVCLVISLVLYKLGMPKAYTRKVVHILVGFEWIFLYNFLGAGIHFLIVCIAFLLLLLVAYFAKLMPMISSDEDNAPGTVYYAVAMTGVAIVGCFVPEVMLPFGIGIFCTSLGDGFAGLVGQMITKNNPKIYGKKTLFGAIANFVFSFLSAYIMSILFEMGITVWHSLAIALLSTSLELVVGYGLDNIAVTWSVTALAYAFMYFDGISSYLIPILLTPIIVAFALRKKALTPSGVVAALALDLAVSLTLGNIGFTLLFSFFALGIIFDKIKNISKKMSGEIEEEKSAKGECRDHFQVLANGLIPALCALLFAISKDYVFMVGYVAALAEALSDTAASAIGASSDKTFDLFKFRKCERGMSGGMSVIGTLASALGAALIGSIAIMMGVLDLKLTTIAVGSAFLGAVFDSFLGSVFQVKYRCSVCGKLTERTEHCKAPTQHLSGLKLVDNDVVNLLSGLFAAGLAISITAWIF
ncbi:MAG: DUF92 domain-containing protein [Clostridia bacterium]|nr:DUF92 domain-containing protein [Clostridia bacterium]